MIAVVPSGKERLALTATKFAWRQVNWRGESLRTAIWDLLPEARKREILTARTERMRMTLQLPYVSALASIMAARHPIK